MAVDPWTPVDDPASRVRKAIPGAQITSERRSAARNAAVGGSPTSDHLSGFAADFIPPKGSDPAAVEAALRNQGGFDQIIYEGDHVHYSDSPRGRGQVFGMKGARAPDPWAPVQPAKAAADPWAPVSTTPPAPSVARPAATPPPKTAAPPKQDPWTPVADYFGNMGKRAGSAFTMAGHQLAEDARTAYAPSKGGAGQLRDTPQLRAADKLGLDLWHVVSSPATAVAKGLGNLNQEDAQFVSNVGASVIPLGRGAKAVEEGGAAPHAITTDPKLGKPAVPHPETADGAIVGNEKDVPTRVDNALYRLGGHATSGKLEALQTLRRAPKEIRDPKVQEELTHAVEAKMADPNAQIPEHLQAAERVRQPWAERQRTAINEIRQKLAARGATEQEIEDFAPDSGYVPRRVVGKSPGIDPTERQSPLAWTQGKKSLAKTTGSMKARDQIVLETPDGKRIFEHRNPTNDEWKVGMQVRHPVTGELGTVKQATIKEIEQAGARDSKGAPLTYHKNALVNTIDEALRAERVNRNLDVLDELTKGLKEKGLAHQDEWHF